MMFKYELYSSVEHDYIPTYVVQSVQTSNTI